jgi:hypothetical protein
MILTKQNLIIVSYSLTEGLDDSVYFTSNPFKREREHEYKMMMLYVGNIISFKIDCSSIELDIKINKEYNYKERAIKPFNISHGCEIIDKSNNNNTINNITNLNIKISNYEINKSFEENFSFHFDYFHNGQNLILENDRLIYSINKSNTYNNYIKITLLKNNDLENAKYFWKLQNPYDYYKIIKAKKTIIKNKYDSYFIDIIYDDLGIIL